MAKRMKRNNLFIGILTLLISGYLLSCNHVHDGHNVNKNVDRNIEIKHYVDTINNNIILTTTAKHYSYGYVSVSTLKLKELK
jgi:hypothetical protein